MKYYNQRIHETLSKLDRRTADVLFSAHAAKDKNLNDADVDYVVSTVRIGKVDINKSRFGKICFKHYVKTTGDTYFVIVAYYPAFIKIITVIKKKGKY